MDLHRVSISTLPTAWPVVAPLLAPCVEMLSGEYVLEDVYAFVYKGLWQMWAVVEPPDKVFAVVVTEVVKYPRKQILRVVLLGGAEVEKWIDLFKYIEDWAISVGCKGAEAWCRPGMSKQLRTLDFISKCTVCTKDFQEPEHETIRAA